MPVKVAHAYYCLVSPGSDIDGRPQPWHVRFSAQWSQDWVFISLAARFPFMVLQLLLDSFVQVDERFILRGSDSKLIWKTRRYGDIPFRMASQYRWNWGALTMPPAGKDGCNGRLWGKKIAQQNWSLGGLLAPSFWDLEANIFREIRNIADTF